MQVRIDSLYAYYRYTFEEGYRFDGHTHEAWEINIVLSKSMSITYNGEVVTLSQGDFFLGEPRAFHCNRALSGGAEMAVIQFFSDSLPKRGHFCARGLDKDEYGTARLLLSEIERLCGHVYPGGLIRNYDPEVYADALKLCEVLLSRVAGGENDVRESTAGRAALYREAVKYMEANIASRITIPELAKALCVCPASLKSVFLEYTGGGAVKYFNEMKIHAAREMLAHGSSISFVSDSLGFSSPCYFSYVFKHVTGVCAKNYQQGNPRGHIEPYFAQNYSE